MSGMTTDNDASYSKYSNSAMLLKYDTESLDTTRKHSLSQKKPKITVSIIAVFVAYSEHF